MEVYVNYSGFRGLLTFLFWLHRHLANTATLIETRPSCSACGTGRFTYPGEFTGSEKLGEFHPSEDVFILFPFNLDARFNPRLITERDLAQNKSLYPRNGLV